MQKLGRLPLFQPGRLQLRDLSIGHPGIAASCHRWRNDRLLSTSTDAPPPQSRSQVQEHQEPFRKTLKDTQRALKQAERNTTKAQTRGEPKNAFEDWRLTIGLEIHAQLNTARKLFSEAKTSSDAEPNTNVVPFDLAFPGTQPHFQKATLIPALRAALAFNCTINLESKFDRKHYFYQDQPAGYQITQYYAPYASNGHITLGAYDGFEGAQDLLVRIKQIQMEQDTAKSTLQDDTTALLDFNRVGHPLIEIITEPDIHSPQEAVACVRKIQSTLQAVNAVTTGMEMGGLRADVNVSVVPNTAPSEHLGQRVEIKNLSTLQSIKAAIKAEMRRQVRELLAGRSISGETRAWSLGSAETRRLRGKEGEVDYRYMPDPDIPPLVIGQDLVTKLKDTLPQLPDDVVKDLHSNCGLTLKDAKTLATLEDGQRLDYYDDVVKKFKEWNPPNPNKKRKDKSWTKEIGDWVIHRIGHLLASAEPSTRFTSDLVPSDSLARIIVNIQDGTISRAAAKEILETVYHGDTTDIGPLIVEVQGKTMSKVQYSDLANNVLDKHKAEVESIIEKGQLGKLMFLVGRTVQEAGKGNIDPQIAEQTLREKLGLPAKEK